MHTKTARCRRVSVDPTTKRWRCTCGAEGETRPSGDQERGRR